MKSPSPLSPAERERRLSRWAAKSGVDLAKLDAWQKAVVLAALTFLGFSGALPALRRLVAYLLSHCGLGLSSTVISAVVGTTDRAVRKGRQVPPRQFCQQLRQPRRGHRAPKLRQEQVGPVAKFLAEHRRCSVAEVLDFLQRTFGVQMDRLTLRRFLQRYGLGCLREDSVVHPPLFSAAPPTEAPSR
jgi:transposase